MNNRVEIHIDEEIRNATLLGNDFNELEINNCNISDTEFLLSDPAALTLNNSTLNNCIITVLIEVHFQSIIAGIGLPAMMGKLIQDNSVSNLTLRLGRIGTSIDFKIPPDITVDGVIAVVNEVTEMLQHSYVIVSDNRLLLDSVSEYVYLARSYAGHGLSKMILDCFDAPPWPHDLSDFSDWQHAPVDSYSEQDIDTDCIEPTPDQGVIIDHCHVMSSDFFPTLPCQMKITESNIGEESTINFYEDDMARLLYIPTLVYRTIFSNNIENTSISIGTHPSNAFKIDIIDSAEGNSEYAGCIHSVSTAIISILNGTMSVGPDNTIVIPYDSMDIAGLVNTIVTDPDENSITINAGPR